MKRKNFIYTITHRALCRCGIGGTPADWKTKVPV